VDVRVVFGPEVFGQRYGGISRYYVELHRRLPAHGVDSRILAGAHQNAYLRGVPGVRGIEVPAALRRERLRVLREGANDALAVAALRLGSSRAVYHQTYYQGHAGERHRGPHVVTAYDLVHAKFPEHFPADDPTVAQQRRVFDRADLVLAISATTKADLVEVFGIHPDRILVTHLGVSPAGPVGRAAGLDEPFLLYVGQRFGYKNWARCMAAFAASGLARAMRAVCTGLPFTPDELALLEELGLTGRVLHVPADDELLDALYREARAFVYPSLYEGFGLPPLEAMVRGCPVVAARAGSIPEVLGDAAVYADPVEVDSLAAALVEATRPERRAELASRGCEQAAGYTWDATARATAEAYRGLS